MKPTVQLIYANKMFFKKQNGSKWIDKWMDILYLRPGMELHAVRHMHYQK
jgi:hypothetical protein